MKKRKLSWIEADITFCRGSQHEQCMSCHRNLKRFDLGDMMFSAFAEPEELVNLAKEGRCRAYLEDSIL